VCGMTTPLSFFFALISFLAFSFIFVLIPFITRIVVFALGSTWAVGSDSWLGLCNLSVFWWLCPSSCPGPQAGEMPLFIGFSDYHHFSSHENDIWIPV
jgi:hypothetical protein